MPAPTTPPPADRAAMLALVIAAVAEEFMVAPASLDAATTAADVPGWDSISHTMLVMRLEDRLDRPLDAWALQHATNVGDMADEIGRQGQGSALDPLGPEAPDPHL